VTATVYALWMIQRTFHGEKRKTWPILDLSFRELAVLGAMVLALAWLGLYPRPVLHTAEPFVQQTVTEEPSP
jgi:NADH-quinone oxidoreductase subunit M